MLLNMARTKRFILEQMKKTRPHLGINRVSRESLEIYEAKLRGIIIGDIQRHRSSGKTFKP